MGCHGVLVRFVYFSASITTTSTTRKQPTSNNNLQHHNSISSNQHYSTIILIYILYNNFSMLNRFISHFPGSMYSRAGYYIAFLKHSNTWCYDCAVAKGERGDDLCSAITFAPTLFGALLFCLFTSALLCAACTSALANNITHNILVLICVSYLLSHKCAFEFLPGTYRLLNIF